jgi:2,4-dienoyl-CoA reductase-like NADH-dependent reductase (Old Yellow Enzyme family)
MIMSNETIYPTLFSSYNIGNLTIPNRIVMAPMTRSQSPDNIPSPEVAQYYRRRVEGGVGIIITECTFIDHPVANGFAEVPAFHGETALNGWKRVVKEVHDTGGLIMPQIWHARPSRLAGIAPNASMHGVGPIDVIENDVQTVTGISASEP